MAPISHQSLTLLLNERMRRIIEIQHILIETSSREPLCPPSPNPKAKGRRCVQLVQHLHRYRVSYLPPFAYAHNLINPSHDAVITLDCPSALR